MSGTTSRRLRVLLACSGLDHVHRGFETFARECFEALRGAEELDVTLVKGSGPAGQCERSVPTVKRHSAAARALARAWGREPFRVEQVSFGASLLPLIARQRPDVVYFSEWHTGLVLGAARRVLPGMVGLAYCNGASAVAGFGHLDQVQELTPGALRVVLDHGADPQRQTLLPLGCSIDPQFRDVTPAERSGLRERLGLPADAPIVLSVAALNRQKRIDYLIEEVARLPAPRPYLVLLGHREPETAEFEALARERLGAQAHTIRTVPPAEVNAFYRACDVVVLASLGESFGRVLVEAMAQGLPCIAHDYEVNRYLLGEHGRLGDLSRSGGLAALLSSAIERDAARGAARHAFVYERFSWERLRPSYVSFLKAAAGRATGQPRAVANSTVSSSTGEQVWRKNR